MKGNLTKYQRLDPKNVLVYKICPEGIKKDGSPVYVIMWYGLQWGKMRDMDENGGKIDHAGPHNYEKQRMQSGASKEELKLGDSTLPKGYSDANAQPKLSMPELHATCLMQKRKLDGPQTIDEYFSSVLSEDLSQLYEKARNSKGLHYQTCIDILTMLNCKLNNNRPFVRHPYKGVNIDFSEKTYQLKLANVRLVMCYDDECNAYYRIARNALTDKEKSMINGEMDKFVQREKVTLTAYTRTIGNTGYVAEEKDIEPYLSDEEKMLYEYALSCGHYQTCIDILEWLEVRLNRTSNSDRVKLTTAQRRKLARLNRRTGNPQ